MTWIALLSMIAGAAPTPEQVFARTSPGVGFVAAGDHFGSVVVVAANRVVTNWHVLDGAEGPTIVVVGEVKSPAVLVGLNAEQDLAVLQLLKGNLKGIPPRRASLPVVGEKVFTIGSPQGLANTFADGVVSNLQMVAQRVLIQTTAPISRGSSGGGLFDAQGRLLGITTLFLSEGQQLNFAVPTSALEALLKELLAQSEAVAAVNALSVESRALLVKGLSKVEAGRLPNLDTNETEPGGAAVPAGLRPEKSAPATEVKKKTAAASWSNFGWMGFRWGMGPADVLDRLRDPIGEFRAKGFSCTVMDVRVRSIECRVEGDGHDLFMLGESPDLGFWFYEGQLFTCQLVFRFDGPGEDGQKLFRGIGDALTKKYNRPSYSSPKPASPGSTGRSTIEWDQPALHVELEAMYAGADAYYGASTTIFLSYKDPERAERWRLAPIPK